MAGRALFSPGNQSLVFSLAPLFRSRPSYRVVAGPDSGFSTKRGCLRRGWRKTTKVVKTRVKPMGAREARIKGSVITSKFGLSGHRYK